MLVLSRRPEFRHSPEQEVFHGSVTRAKITVEQRESGVRAPGPRDAPQEKCRGAEADGVVAQPPRRGSNITRPQRGSGFPGALGNAVEEGGGALQRIRRCQRQPGRGRPAGPEERRIGQRIYQHRGAHPDTQIDGGD